MWVSITHEYPKHSYFKSQEVTTTYNSLSADGKNTCDTGWWKRLIIGENNGGQSIAIVHIWLEGTGLEFWLVMTAQWLRCEKKSELPKYRDRTYENKWVFYLN